MVGGGLVSEQAMQQAQASYRRACARPDFIAAFYRHFLAACPEAEPKFAQTDFERQHKLLQHAIGLLLIFPKQPSDEPGLLTRVAERHSRRDINVPPALYGPFVDSLVATVKQFDPQFTPAIEGAWRTTLATGVVYMKSKY